MYIHIMDRCIICIELRIHIYICICIYVYINIKRDGSWGTLKPRGVGLLGQLQVLIAGIEGSRPALICRGRFPRKVPGSL